MGDNTSDQLAAQSPWDVWTRRLGTFAVAAVAAYASYEHQRGFALAGGADLTTARLWPLSVDGLLVLSTAGLLRNGRQTNARMKAFLWATFGAGIVVSLAANIATAPSMTWGAIVVAGWPPVALLLAVELLGQRHQRTGADPGPARETGRGETGSGAAEKAARGRESGSEKDSRSDGARPGGNVVALAASRLVRRTAEQVMWQHYQDRVRAGLPAPTGAELDAVAGANNYGRAVLRKWRRTGRLGHVAIRAVDGADPY